MSTTTTLKSRITNLLPRSNLGTNVTVKQIVARLNRNQSFTPVANATVRGRLSELVASGAAASEARNTGVTGFYSLS